MFSIKEDSETLLGAWGMQRQIKVAITVSILVLVFSHPDGDAFAGLFWDDANGDPAISKGTTIHLLDGSSHELLEPSELEDLSVTILPAGTRILIFKNKDPIMYKGSIRFRILTEHGLWGYIKAVGKGGKKNYWSDDDLRNLASYGSVGFIKRDGFATRKDIDRCKELVTRGEKYKVQDEGHEVLGLAIGKRDYVCKKDSESAAVQLVIPNKLLNFIEFPSGNGGDLIEQLSEEWEKLFKPRRRLVFGALRKSCDVQLSEEVISKLAARFAIKIGAEFQGIGVSGEISAGIERNLKSSRSHPAGIFVGEIHSVRERDIPRLLEVDFWMQRIVFKDNTICRNVTGATKDEIFSITYIGSGFERVLIDQHAVDIMGLSQTAANGRIRVTCIEEYFSAADVLMANGIKPRDIDFLLSRTSILDDYGNLGRCLQEKDQKLDSTLN